MIVKLRPTAREITKESLRCCLFFLPPLAISAVLILACFWIGKPPENSAYRFLTSQNIIPDAWPQTTSNEITHLFLKFLQTNLCELNAWGVVVVIFGACLFGALAAPTLRALKFSRSEKVIICVLFFSFFIYNFCGTPEYNHYAYVIGCAVAGLVLRNGFNKPGFGLTAIYAVLLGLLCSIKITSGAALTLSLFLAFFSSKDKGKSAGFIVLLPLLTIISGYGFFRLLQGKGVPEASMPSEVFPEFGQFVQGIGSAVGMKIGPNSVYALRVLGHNGLEIVVLAILMALIWKVGKKADGLPPQKKYAIFRGAVLVLLSWLVLGVSFGDQSNEPFFTSSNFVNLSTIASSMVQKSLWYGKTSVPLILLLGAAWVCSGAEKKAIKKDNFIEPWMFLPLIALCIAFGTYARLVHHGVIFSWLFLITLVLAFKNKKESGWFLRKKTVQAAGLIFVLQFINQAMIHFEGFKSRTIFDLASTKNNKFFCTEKIYKELKESLFAIKKSGLKSGDRVLTQGAFFPICLANLKITTKPVEIKNYQGIIFSTQKIEHVKNNRFKNLSFFLAADNEPFRSKKQAAVFQLIKKYDLQKQNEFIYNKIKYSTYKIN